MSEFSHPAKPTMFSMVVTPMDGQGRLDEAGIRAHLRRQIEAGVGVYLGSGGSGEGHALTIDELGRLYRIGVDECKGKVPVYCNPPEARSANEMLDKSRQAIDAGADLVQFYQLDAGHGRMPVLAEQELYFRDLLEAIDHPVGISIHLAAGYLAPCALVTKLCLEYPQIRLVNIPFGPTMNYLVQLRDGVPDTIKIYVGMHNILSGLAMGAWGAQVTETNQIPHLCQAMIDEFVAGDIARAAETYAHVLRVTDVIDSGRRVSADGPKAALKALGFDVGLPRHPRVPVDDATVEQMRSAFARLGTLELEAAAAARSTSRRG
ncbi:MAG TPA: dihydrodipicolinate synthase family protein [Acidimicrobiales bacterium]|nr:dihydrodipicolinate synthase family protein [Acidimicrobiales bacterium]